MRRDGGSRREEKIIVRVFVEWSRMKKLGLQSSGLLMWIADVDSKDYFDK